LGAGIERYHSSPIYLSDLSPRLRRHWYSHLGCGDLGAVLGRLGHSTMNCAELRATFRRQFLAAFARGHLFNALCRHLLTEHPLARCGTPLRRVFLTEPVLVALARRRDASSNPRIQDRKSTR